MCLGAEITRMIIGIPREIKSGEGRVALAPGGVRTLHALGATVRVEAGAGTASGFDDATYADAGATIVPTAAQAFNAELVVKVKEIQPGEWQHLRPGQILFSFLHLGADPRMAQELLERRITGIAFETVADKAGGLPILAPMSALAGEMALPIAAWLLASSDGSKKILREAVVLVLGAGAAGAAAARTAIALGATVTVVAKSDRRLAMLRAEFGSRIRTLTIANADLPQLARSADVVIGAVNVPGAASPTLLTRRNIAAMRRGSVLIDICIDGGGTAETSRATTLAAPTYIDEGVIHYGVPNMPAAAPRAASEKISTAILPYITSLLQQGLLHAMRDNDGLLAGLQMHGGNITHHKVAAQLGLPCLDLDAVLFAC